MALLSELFVKISGNASSGKAAAADMSKAIAGMGAQITAVNANMTKMGPTSALTFNRIKKGADKMNKELRTSRFHSANLMAQFNDIGVMMASGQSPFILAVQQGTQISQVLQSIGTTGKGQLSALWTALKATVGWTSLLTIGLIAGTAALVQWGMKAASAKEAASNYEEAVKSLRDRLQETTLANDAFRAGFDNVEEFVATQELEQMKKTLLDIVDRIEQAKVGTGSIRDGTKESVGLLEAQAATLSKQIGDRVKLLESVREQNRIAEQIKATEDDIHQIHMKVVDGPLNKAVQMYRRRTEEAAKTLAIEQNIASAAAMGFGGQGVSGPDAAIGGLRGQGRLGGELAGVLGVTTHGPNSKKKSGSAKSDPLEGELERLQESLRTATESELNAYVERQRILEESLNKKLITQQTHDEMMERMKRDHEQKMVELDVWRYGSSLDKTGAFLGEMASLTQSGNEKMFRIAKAAGAAQALISTWQGAAKALELGFPQNMFAFAQVLSTGLGAVNAIKGISANGSGPTSAGGPAAGGAANTPAEPSQQRSLTLIGDRFNRQQAIEIAEFMNDGTDERASSKRTTLMSIEITGTFADGKFPRVLHDGNRFNVKTVTASTEVTDYPGTAANFGNTVDRWRPFANALETPQDINGTTWAVNELTKGVDGQTITETTANAVHLIQQAFTFTSVEHVVAFKVERQTVPEIRIYAFDGSGAVTCFFDLRDGTVGTAAGCTGQIVDLGSGVFLCSIYWTPSAGTGVVELETADGAENVTFVGSTDNTLKIIEAYTHVSAATLRYDLFGDAAGDCIAIAAHNLWSSGARIQIEHDSNDDDTFTVIDDLTPTDDSPIMFFFDAITSSRWRITVDRGALPEVGVFRVGAALKFERPFYSGFSVPRMSRNTEVTGNLSGSGQLLGRSRKWTTLNAKYDWQNLTYAWVRANLDGPTGLIQSLEKEPAFVAWRPSETEDVEYLMRASAEAPSAQGVRDLHTFSMSGEAHAYE